MGPVAPLSGRAEGPGQAAAFSTARPVPTRTAVKPSAAMRRARVTLAATGPAAPRGRPAPRTIRPATRRNVPAGDTAAARKPPASTESARTTAVRTIVPTAAARTGRALAGPLGVRAARAASPVTIAPLRGRNATPSEATAS